MIKKDRGLFFYLMCASQNPKNKKNREFYFMEIHFIGKYIFAKRLQIKQAKLNTAFFNPTIFQADDQQKNI